MDSTPQDLEFNSYCRPCAEVSDKIVITYCLSAPTVGLWLNKELNLAMSHRPHTSTMLIFAMYSSKRIARAEIDVPTPREVKSDSVLY